MSSNSIVSDQENRRLADLLIEPRETMNVEHKAWLDLADPEHKAIVAKAIIALANHGGGFIIFGIDDKEKEDGPFIKRPDKLSGFNVDAINSIVSRYCEPIFHCDLVFETAPSGEQHPIVLVPGGHKVPIRSSSDGPSGKHLKNNSYYIRRGGPKSEVPQSGLEWDELIKRAISNSKEDIADLLRKIIGGGIETVAEPTQDQLTASWFSESANRWQERIAHLPPDHEARMPNGHYSVGYTLQGDFKVLPFDQLVAAVDRATMRYTGWPQFWVPTRKEIEPRPYHDSIEVWLGSDESSVLEDAAHSDFWRVSQSGKAFLIRGFQEDGIDYGERPGQSLDLTVPVWRVAETFLHAAALADQLGDPSSKVAFKFAWTGLKGRQLTVNANSSRYLREGHKTYQDQYSTTISATGSEISNFLPELVSQVISPLYQYFSFFSLPSNLVVEEIGKMRQNRF